MVVEDKGDARQSSRDNYRNGKCEDEQWRACRKWSDVQ